MAAVRDESMAGLVPSPRCRPGKAARNAAASTRAASPPRPNGTTSIGNGKRPSIATHLESSAITTMRAEADATIFSRSSAPPPPLIRLRSGAISSAPSMVRSSSGVSSSVVSGMPHCSACGARRLRGRHRDDVEAGAHPFAQQFDERPGGRAGAEPEPHAGPDKSSARPPPAVSIRPWSRADDASDTADVRRPRI